MNSKEVGAFEGRPVHEIVLRNSAGARANVLTWGAVLRELVVQLPSGARNVVLGFDSFEPYPIHSRSFGAIIGRFANRIAEGRFCLDGETYQLTQNDGVNSMHGGAGAFGKRLWSIVDGSDTHVSLSLVSPDGDSGYPGRLQANCTYTLTDFATLRIDLTATTDRATIVNLTNHSYFNLVGTGDISAHKLRIEADFYTPARSDSIPTGEIRAVAGSAFDFAELREIGSSDIDINFVLNRPISKPKPLIKAATLLSPNEPLGLEVWTTQPGLQLYNGYKLDVAVPGSNGERYKARAGVALETQHFPNSPNVSHFPCTTLRPDEVYSEHTEFRLRMQS